MNLSSAELATFESRMNYCVSASDRCFSLVHQAFAERLARECGCVSPSIQRLLLGERIRLFESGRCLSVFARSQCTLRGHTGVASHILKLILFLLSPSQIVRSRPLCPYRKNNTRVSEGQSQNIRR